MRDGLIRYGFLESQIHLMNDGKLVLEALGNNGVVVIAGTGSVCLGKRETAVFQSGGLGLVLGNEGSGYRIGLNAIKAVLAAEQGWGEETPLLDALLCQFHLNRMVEIIRPITAHHFSTSEIASLCPLVFRFAQQEDRVAKQIIRDAASELGILLANVIERVNAPRCEVFLVGGVFKADGIKFYLDALLSCKEMSEVIDRYQPRIRNISHENPAFFAAEKIFQRSQKQ